MSLFPHTEQSPAGQRQPGTVTLVGAGPGDPDLLTLKAVKALQAADIILFDYLVSDAVLDLARQQARRMLVGKRGYRPSCKQRDINEMMIRLARRGRHVVRLKSGDPMVFGRAGEEISQLKQAGISFEVVPGITAASAMASSLGVSLTHREHAQSVQYVTGHGKDGGLPQGIDWHAVASLHTTSVFYMGARMSANIATELMANGLPASHPTVACTSVSREEQVVWAGRLADLSQGVAQLGYDAPLIIGVGAVFHAVAEELGGQTTGSNALIRHTAANQVLLRAM